MKADAQHLAKVLYHWDNLYTHCYLVEDKFIGGPRFNDSQGVSKEEWQAARDELENPFSSPEEDEAWQAAEERMDVIGHNGATGEHYSSGGDNEYWVVQVKSPKRLKPYSAECEDLIELFQMTFQEGEAFKALWRKGQMRIGNGKPGDTLLRNSEKVFHFGGRMVAMEQGR